MVSEKGPGIWVQQDTTHVVQAADTLVAQKPDTVRKDTSLKTRPGGTSLDALEKLFIQTDRRLKKDSVAAVKKKPVAVKRKEKKKVQQEPADSIFLTVTTSRPPDNAPLSVASRSWFTRDLLAADSSKEYLPLQKKGLPLKSRVLKTETREPLPVAVKREPAFLRENWILGVLIFSFLLITWTRIRFGKLLNQTLSGIWNYKNSNALFRNKSSLYQGASVILTSNYFVVFSLFLYFFLKAFYPSVFTGGFSHLKVYLYIMAGVAAVYFYFLLVIRLTELITRVGEPFGEFAAFTRIFFHDTGLLLFPLTAIIPYVYEPVARRLLWAGLFLVAVLYLFRVVKLITIFIRERFSLFLMILYLCTLEILPVAILLKIISG